ncbi:MAG: energy transducer TonB [Limnohabitans sp.]|nr:energy transducer TonB [Limnohabitans sp.]
MKNILLVILLSIPFVSFSQEENDRVFYYDSIGHIATKDNYHYYKIVKDYNNSQKTYKYLYYDKFDQVYEEGFSVDKTYKKNVGEFKSYYKNGNTREIIQYDSLSQKNGKFVEYYENGKKAAEGENIETDKKWNHIIVSFWNPNGKQTVTNGNGFYSLTTLKEKYFLAEKGFIKNGLREGQWEGKESYSKDVNCLLTFTENYSNGELIEGCSYDDDYNPYIYTEQLVVAEPSGGISTFLKYIQRNYHTDQIAETITTSIEGRVIVEFVIETDGSFGDIRVLKDLGYGTGDEAIRTLKRAPKFLPGKMRGRVTRTKYMLPIALSIPAE